MLWMCSGNNSVLFSPKYNSLNVDFKQDSTVQTKQNKKLSKFVSSVNYSSEDKTVTWNIYTEFVSIPSCDYGINR